MPIYRYSALTYDGNRKHGSVFAPDFTHAYDLLESKKYHPLHISQIRLVSKKVQLEDLLMFFMHIDFQLKCGVPIDEAIASFMDFCGNKIFNASLADMLTALQNGEGISAAFEKCHSIFSSIIVGLIKSAEETGQISEAITNILAFLKLQSEWKNKVKRAISYPLFITAVAIVVLILSVVVLGPQVVSLTHAVKNDEVPWLTQIAIEVLPQLANILCVSCVMTLVVGSCLACTRYGRQLLSNMLLKIPRVGPLILKITLWQFCKVLDIACASKLDFVKGVRLAVDAVSFRKKELCAITNYLMDGYTIAEAFSQTNVIPEGIIMAIYVGEKGNNLASCFRHISDTQYNEILFDIKSFGRCLSVGLTLFTGAIFVFILYSLFYPIYNYVEFIGG